MKQPEYKNPEGMSSLQYAKKIKMKDLAIGDFFVCNNGTQDDSTVYVYNGYGLDPNSTLITPIGVMQVMGGGFKIVMNAVKFLRTKPFSGNFEAEVYKIQHFEIRFVSYFEGELWRR